MNPNLSAGQFYHGTRRRFAPGEMVTSEAARGGDSRRKFTYAERDVNDARGWSHDAPGEGTAKTYQVEPTGPPERGYEDFHIYKSAAPMKVIRRVSYFPPRQRQAEMEAGE
jgi:hypothetical protein